MKKAQTLLFLFLVIVFFTLPVFSDACSMCQSGYSKLQVNAYRQITLLLALLPLLASAGIFFWIYRRYKTAE